MSLAKHFPEKSFASQAPVPNWATGKSSMSVLWKPKKTAQVSLDSVAKKSKNFEAFSVYFSLIFHFFLKRIPMGETSKVDYDEA